jgi:hypothetical protein
MALFFQGRDRVFYSHGTAKNSVSCLRIDGSVLSGERPSFFCALKPKTRSLVCVSMVRYFRGRDRVFYSHGTDKNSVSCLRIDGSVLSGERPSFLFARHSQKLGLLSAYRWLCSSRGETEFFSRATPEKLGLSILVCRLIQFPPCFVTKGINSWRRSSLRMVRTACWGAASKARWGVSSEIIKVSSGS